MQYKRSEYFRYAFGEPLEAEFRIIVENGTKEESSPGDCELMDLSPGGMKFFTTYDIPLDGKPVKLHIKFTLQSVPIDVRGIIKWKKPNKNGQLYGFDFEKDAALEKLIVDELKLRRRAEIETEK